MPSKYYNHGTWPSPNAKIAVKNLRLDVLPNGERIKRITHDQALDILRKKCGKETIEDFLAMRKDRAWHAIGSVDFRGNARDPLYR
jgi:hypothetical protein